MTTANMSLKQFELSTSQRLIWMGQRLHPDAPLYNMIFTFTIDSAVNVDLFQTAFNALLTVCENLRTVVWERDGSPQQVILPHTPVDVEFVDLSEQASPQAALRAWVDKRRAQKFELDTGLYDTALIKLSPSSYVWYLNLHHVITDIWSVRLIYGHMSRLYAQAAGESFVPPVLPAYEAYIGEEAAGEIPAVAAARAFWQAQLGQEAEPVSLYGENNAADWPRTERHSLTLSAEQMARLLELAASPGIRSFTRELTHANLFGALILTFLRRMSGNSAIRLGMPFANRGTLAYRETIGLFIEVLSLHVSFDEGETFTSMVKKVAAANFRALQNLVPGAGTAAHNRAFNMLLNYISLAFPDFAGMPTHTEWIHSGFGDSHHSIRFQVHDLNARGQYQIDFDFNTRAYTEADRQRVLEHFARVLESCLHDPERPISTISLLNDDEYQRNVRDFNATSAPVPLEKTVIDLIEAQAARTPDAVAIRLADSVLTYRQLNSRANALARELAICGVKAETLVPVCMENSIELVTALLAILKAGGAYVPIDPASPADRIQMLLDDIGAAPLLVAHSNTLERLPVMPISVFNVDSLPLDAGDIPNPPRAACPENLAYMIYTSGTTGKPKGVMVQHDNLISYLWWAKQQYTDGEPSVFALYSSLAFDLTVTSIYVPLITGGSIHVYPDVNKNGLLIRDIFRDNAVDVVKLTPSHLTLVRDIDLTATRIKKLIVGGEDFKTELALAIHRASNGRITQYNEYGPTEATVACMIHAFQPQHDLRSSVPIGRPSHNMQVYVLDAHLQHAPTAVIGEMYLAGANVARGYYNRPELTTARFLPDPFTPGQRMYKTGDLARWLPSGQLEFLGRRDHQVKVGGVRIELGEVEAALLSHPQISAAAVDVRVVGGKETAHERTETFCARCGLSSNYPGVTFNVEGVCSVCQAYDGYRHKAQTYFKGMDELRSLAQDVKRRASGSYDCIALLSGGKDSTYMIHQLVSMNLRVLSFTLDNGYISNEAKANIRRVTQALGVDHIFSETPYMNAIFVDSLNRYANVCNGCFKTLYTMAINLAREKGIGAIFTGLSRGQFFETRLTEEVFQRDDFDVRAIDESIQRARKAYHQREDVISRALDVDLFRDDALLDDIQFIDFYRYCDISLDEIYTFLIERGLWTRPSDTGRSTNCLINEVGIYIHKKRKGFHNYALPYSWDVRMGHKTRDQAVDELNDEIDPARVQRILHEIGYADAPPAEEGQQRLVAYYVSDQLLSAAEVRDYLRKTLTEPMIPAHFVRLETIPLSASGKVNRAALPHVNDQRAEASAGYAPPTSAIEETLVGIWKEVLYLDLVGVHDNFFDLGGHSLPAIRIVSRIRSAFEIDLPIDVFFANPTVAQLAAVVDDRLLAQIEALSDEEARQLLAGED